jgi:hypothetical protein
MPLTLYIHRGSLHRLLDEISVFVQKDASCVFLKLLFTKNERIDKISEYHVRIGTLIAAFQVTCHIFCLLYHLTRIEPTDIGAAEHP